VPQNHLKLINKMKKVFIENLNKVAQDVPSGLVRYLSTSTSVGEIREALDVVLSQEYSKPLDWLYSTVNAQFKTRKIDGMWVVDYLGTDWTIIEDGGLIDLSATEYVYSTHISAEGLYFDLFKLMENGRPVSVAFPHNFNNNN